MFPWDGSDENRKSCDGLIQVYSRDSSLEYIEDFWERRPGKEPFIINSHSILVLEPFGTSLNILIEFKFISKQRIYYYTYSLSFKRYTYITIHLHTTCKSPPKITYLVYDDHTTLLYRMIASVYGTSIQHKLCFYL